MNIELNQVHRVGRASLRFAVTQGMWLRLVLALRQAGPGAELAIVASPVRRAVAALFVRRRPILTGSAHHRSKHSVRRRRSRPTAAVVRQGDMFSRELSGMRS